MDDLEGGFRKLPGLFRSKKRARRKTFGFVLLGLALLYWVAFPIIPFLDIPNKIAVMSVLVVVGEIVFVIAIAFLGKEYWAEIKQWVRQRLSWRRR